MSDRFIDVSPTERAAIVTRELMLGKALTPKDISELTECTLDGGYKVLHRLSRVLPLYEEDGRWLLLQECVALNIE